MQVLFQFLHYQQHGVNPLDFATRGVPRLLIVGVRRDNQVVFRHSKGCQKFLVPLLRGSELIFQLREDDVRTGLHLALEWCLGNARRFRLVACGSARHAIDAHANPNAHSEHRDQGERGGGRFFHPEHAKHSFDQLGCR